LDAALSASLFATEFIPLTLHQY
jgi:hypothetical protein